MMNKILNNTFGGNILKKSPWDDADEENIFTKKRGNTPNFKDFEFNFNNKTIFLIIIAFILLWLASGIYKVQEGEQGVVLRFGKLDRESTPGLNYHLPSPFEVVLIEKVNQSRRIEIGYRSTGATRRSGAASSREVGNESIMLTGDENIIELNADVTWSISGLPNFLFNIIDPQDTVKSSAESAIREVIANTPIALVLSSQKQEISEKIENLLQKILDQYGAGVNIEQVQLLKAEPPKEVIQSYREVQIARADREKEINQAQSYNNDILPKARGESAKIIQESQGYKARVIAEAEGNTSRFNFIYKQYAMNKEITRNRLYLETIESILMDSDKVIIGGENNMLPHMAIGKKGILAN